MDDQSVAPTNRGPDRNQTDLVKQLNLSGILVAVKQRWLLIIVVSTAVALIVGGRTFFKPTYCHVTYAYDYSGPDARSHEVFLHRFYSAENIQRLVKYARKAGLEHTAAMLEGTVQRDRATLQKIIDITVWPKHTDLAERIPMDTAEAEAMRKTKPDLTIVTITGPEEGFSGLVSTVRENIERIMPMYAVRTQAEGFAREQRAKISTLRSDERLMELSLEMSRGILKGLRNIPAHRPTDTSAGGLRVEFSIKGGSVEHLPVSYQIQTAESDVTRLEAKQGTNRRRLAYHEKLVGLAKKFLAEVNSPDHQGDYSILNYHSYLGGLRDTLTEADQDTRNYLIAHMDGIQAKISALAPTVANPQIVRSSRGIVRETIRAFCIALAICVVLVNILARRKAARVAADA